MVKNDQVPDLNLDQSDAVVLIKTSIKKYQNKGTKLKVLILKVRISTKMPETTAQFGIDIGYWN